MCHVQRVVNTCGHRNDHVLLVCHIAKSSSHEEQTSQALSSSFQRIATPIGESGSGGSSSRQPSNSGQSADAVKIVGFHASTQPYCIYASIRDLSSPKGFKCMVTGCGRAD